MSPRQTFCSLVFLDCRRAWDLIDPERKQLAVQAQYDLRLAQPVDRRLGLACRNISSPARGEVPQERCGGLRGVAVTIDFGCQTLNLPASSTGARPRVSDPKVRATSWRTCCPGGCCTARWICASRVRHPRTNRQAASASLWLHCVTVLEQCPAQIGEDRIRRAGHDTISEL